MDVCSHDFANAADPELQSRLDALARAAGLGEALEGLRRHQVASGFIRDDLSEVQRFEFGHPDGGGRYFSAQYNPARARRFAGSGVRQPPPGCREVNDGCFLCAENIAWQQRGAEVGYRLPTGRLASTAWMNPFPLAAGHAVVATRDHIHQHWHDSGLGLDTLIAALIELADDLPGWITFYNGVGAGASIETHLHVHALPRTPGLAPMPIEQAAGRLRPADPDTPLEQAIVRGLYPMDFVHWRGRAADLVERVPDWLRRWQHGRRHDTEATANVMAVRDANRAMLDIYFVPRVRSRSRAEGFGGVIGAFEAMGEIICSSPEEHRRIVSGDVDYHTIAGMLHSVSVALE